MKCVRIGLSADVIPYEIGKGLEDGYCLYEKVITNGFVDLDNLITIEINHMLYCPYIKTNRGYTFIKYGDYIIIEEDGSKHVCGKDKVWKRYQNLEKYKKQVIDAVDEFAMHVKSGAYDRDKEVTEFLRKELEEGEKKRSLEKLMKLLKESEDKVLEGKWISQEELEEELGIKKQTTPFQAEEILPWCDTI